MTVNGKYNLGFRVVQGDEDEMSKGRQKGDDLHLRVEACPMQQRQQKRPVLDSFCW